MAHMHAKLIIIGSGPAGYTAAIYAARAMLQPILISGFQPGGQLMITTDVENYPGFADVIQGPWLMEQMRLHAEHVGTRLVSDHVVKVELGARPFRITGDSGDTYSCDALVIATGAQAKWLGLPSGGGGGRPPPPPSRGGITTRRTPGDLWGGNPCVSPPPESDRGAWIFF